MSQSKDQAIQALRRQIDLERKETIRRPVPSARRAEADVDVSQIKIKYAQNLRITEAGNGATVADIGKFWFVPGYSKVGGPDIVPEN